MVLFQINILRLKKKVHVHASVTMKEDVSKNIIYLKVTCTCLMYKVKYCFCAFYSVQTIYNDTNGPEIDTGIIGPFTDYFWSHVERRPSHQMEFIPLE